MKKIVIGVIMLIALIALLISVLWMVSAEGEKGQVELFVGSMTVLLILLLVSPPSEKKSKKFLSPTPTIKIQ